MRSAQVSLGERATGTRFQVPLECHRSFFVAERDHHIKLPRPIPRCVDAFACVVRTQTRRNVVGDARVVVISIVDAPDHIHKTFLSAHVVATGNVCAELDSQDSDRSVGVILRKRQPGFTRPPFAAPPLRWTPSFACQCARCGRRATQVKYVRVACHPKLARRASGSPPSRLRRYGGHHPSRVGALAAVGEPPW